MSKITCELICHSIDRHLQQIYTGFFLLYKRGLIDITQRINTREIRKDRPAFLRVIVDDSIIIQYDTGDFQRIDEGFLNECDFYFKRSFSPAYLNGLGEKRRKVRPLGLNYHVYPDSTDKFAFKRSVYLGHNCRRKLIEVARSLKLLDNLVFAPRVRIMESLPDLDTTAKILFMLRAWDPYDNSDLSGENIEERIQINETRAGCIKMLRDEFGNNVYCGFIHTDFAKKQFKHLLLPDNSMTNQGKYINLLKSYPICVATTGLHRSIGFKFAEYVAFSKAILSEKLNNKVTGNLEVGRNYLEFSSPDELLEKAEQLFSDRDFRNSIMINNSKYYQSFLRPDSLVMNSLLTALSDSNG